jgi:glycosyltransferase involved in cell wall biosynthesis
LRDRPPPTGSSDYRLLIVQPYVPEYRVPFFERLSVALARRNVDMTVYAGQPTGTQVARNDSAVPRPWMRYKPEVEVPLVHRTLRTSRMLTETTKWDGVVLGLRGNSFDVYATMARARVAGVHVGLWGHVAPYVQPGNAIDLRLERWQMKHCDQVFAYTAGGAAFALEAGIPLVKITTLMNSVDVEPLVQARERITAAESDSFRREHGLGRSRVLSYVGGLDASKRIGFLAEALDHLWAMDEGTKLLVAGAGDQAHLLAPAERRGQVVRLGYSGTADKALVASVSQAIVMPGRIGLVAVESLALGIPVLTTDWPHHAPEAEYLVEGQSRFTAKNDARDFARLMARAAGADGAPRSAFPFPDIDTMVTNFASGVAAMRSSD